MYSQMEEDTQNPKPQVKKSKGKIPLLNGCCCCFTIETGAWIIGILHFLGCVFSLIFSSIFISVFNSDEWKNIIKKAIDNDKNGSPNHSGQPTPDDIAALIQVYVKNFLISAIVISCIYMIITALYFVGMYKKKTVFMLPFMTIKLIQIIQFGILSIITLVAFVFAFSLPGFIYLLFSTVFFLLFVYMWIVVYSHYCVLKEENARGQYDKQVYRAS